MVWQPHRACICGLLWTWMLLVGVDARSGSPGTRAIRRPINSASTHAAEATHSLPCGESVEVDAECGGMPQANVDWLRTGQSMEGGDHKCEEFKLMCVDQGSLVVHDPAHNILNGSDLPVFKFSPLEAVWRPPNHDELANAIYRGQTTIAPPIFRPPVAGDPKPIFSNCTLPIILFKSDESNYFHFMLSVMPQIYNWHAHGAVNRDVTYVLATAWGTEAPKFANPLLRPFSRYEVVSLADFSSRLPASYPSNSTGEGRHVRCFQKVVVCHVLDHLQSYPRSLDWAAPNYVYRWYHEKGLLPQNPADFTPLTEGREPRIRVLIEARSGTVRTLDNLESLVRQCNEDPGPWECRSLAMGSDFARDIAAMRSANVFVFVHGAAGANMVYMRNDSAAIEIDPRGFAGVTEGNWPRVFYQHLSMFMDRRIRHFALHIEDPELSWPGKWEELGVGDTFFYQRDRHVRVPWEALRFVLQRIADLKGNKTAYKELEKRGENLLDLLPGGTVQRALQAIERYAAARVNDLHYLKIEALRQAEAALLHQEKGEKEEAARAAKAAWDNVNRAMTFMREAQQVLRGAAAEGRYVNETVRETVDAHIPIAEKLNEDVKRMIPDLKA